MSSRKRQPPLTKKVQQAESEPELEKTAEEQELPELDPFDGIDSQGRDKEDKGENKLLKWQGAIGMC